MAPIHFNSSFPFLIQKVQKKQDYIYVCCFIIWYWYPVFVWHYSFKLTIWPWGGKLTPRQIINPMNIWQDSCQIYLQCLIPPYRKVQDLLAQGSQIVPIKDILQWKLSWIFSMDIVFPFFFNKGRAFQSFGTG